MHFALRSGAEHQCLQIEIPGHTPHLRYYEDVSKNNPGGLNDSQKVLFIMLIHIWRVVLCIYVLLKVPFKSP